MRCLPKKYLGDKQDKKLVMDVKYGKGIRDTKMISIFLAWVRGWEVVKFTEICKITTQSWMGIGDGINHQFGLGQICEVSGAFKTSKCRCEVPFGYIDVKFKRELRSKEINEIPLANCRGREEGNLTSRIKRLQHLAADRGR